MPKQKSHKMRKPVSGKYSHKMYKCNDCGHERLEGTNHWGEIYSPCPKCSWTIGQGMISTCMETCPKAHSLPEKWKLK